MEDYPINYVNSDLTKNKNHKLFCLFHGVKMAELSSVSETNADMFMIEERERNGKVY
jgi:hypothetical protein